MGSGRSSLSFFRRKQKEEPSKASLNKGNLQLEKLLAASNGKYGEQKEEPSKALLDNGNLLLEKLLAASNGKYGVPIRNFTAEELNKATNFYDLFRRGLFSDMYRGSWEERPVLVKRICENFDPIVAERDQALSGVIQDIVTTAQMSHHKNVLKLFGCCLEFKYPVPVFESTGDEYLLQSLLYSSTNKVFSWRSRLKIANGIASALVYLHSAFNTPIIYRILHPNNIIIDRFGVAKLFNFSFSISLPPGKLQVQDNVYGSNGYIDREYALTGIVSPKSDVFSFGVLLLVLLSGSDIATRDEEGKELHIVHWVIDRIRRNELNCLVDSRILEAGETILDQQLRGFIDLALKCTVQRERRPDMIDVAKELLDITRRFS